MSWIVAKLALPITRFSIIRPATDDRYCGGLELLVGLSRHVSRAAPPASASRRKSLGNALPPVRSAASFARRSAMIWFSSTGAAAFGGGVASFMAFRSLR